MCLVTVQEIKGNFVDPSLLSFTSGILPSKRYSKTHPVGVGDQHEAPRSASEQSWTAVHYPCPTDPLASASISTEIVLGDNAFTPSGLKSYS